MKSVSEVPLIDVAEGIFDGPHATPPESQDGPIFLRLDNITPEGRLDLTDLRFINQSDFPRWTRRVTPLPGDVVFSYEATLHRYVVIPEGFHGCLGRRLALIRPNRKKIEPRFLHYYFLSPRWRAVAGSAVINGATVDRISLTLVRNLPVRLPSLQQQQRIVEILSAYDDLIENNRRRMALLEESARLLYQEWFVQLRFPGHEHVRIVNGVPEGWAQKSLGDIAEVVMGQSPESKYYNELGEGLPFHQGVADFGDRFVSNRIFTTAHNRVAFPFDILCSVRAPVGRLNITLDKIIIGRGLAALRSRSGNQSFLFYQLKNHFFKEDLIGSGAIFASVTKTEFLKQRMLNPTKSFVLAFEEVTSSIDEQLRVLYLQNQKLRTTRDLLLPRLMSGEVVI